MDLLSVAPRSQARDNGWHYASGVLEANRSGRLVLGYSPLVREEEGEGLMWIMAKTWADRVAEIAALREKVASLTSLVGDLRESVAKFEEALSAERARSDSAVDRLLEQKGVGSIATVKSPTLDDLSSLFEETDSEVSRIKEAIAYQGAAEVLLGAE